MGIEFDDDPTEPATVTVVPVPGFGVGMSFDPLGSDLDDAAIILFGDQFGTGIEFENLSGNASRNALDTWMPWRRLTIIPDGTLDADERASLVGMYRGP